MNAAVKKNSVYVPSNKLLIVPVTLVTMHSQFFDGVEPKQLKLKGSLLEKTEKYLPTLLLKQTDTNNAIRNNAAMAMIDAFNRVSFVKADYNKHRIFHTAIKKGSILTNISKYCYVIKHVKGIILTYTAVTTTEVLCGEVIHSLGRWDIEIDDGYPDEAVDFFMEAVKVVVCPETKKNAYHVLTDLIFALTPYRN